MPSGSSQHGRHWRAARGKFRHAVQPDGGRDAVQCSLRDCHWRGRGGKTAERSAPAGLHRRRFGRSTDNGSRRDLASRRRNLRPRLADNAGEVRGARRCAHGERQEPAGRCVLSEPELLALLQWGHPARASRLHGCALVPRWDGRLAQLGASARSRRAGLDDGPGLALSKETGRRPRSRKGSAASGRNRDSDAGERGADQHIPPRSEAAQGEIETSLHRHATASLGIGSLARRVRIRWAGSGTRFVRRGPSCIFSCYPRARQRGESGDAAANRDHPGASRPGRRTSLPPPRRGLCRRRVRGEVTRSRR